MEKSRAAEELSGSCGIQRRGAAADVAPDGQRFLTVARAPGGSNRIVVVQNWLREFEP